jgi:DnaJ-class molecular chaperone
MPADLYADLGVDKDAPSDAIRKAYKRRVKETHPDTGGDREQFERVQKAYDVLGDQQKRLTYDTTGNADQKAPDPRELAALNMIVGMLDGFINTDSPELFGADLVAMMREQLREQRGEIIKSLQMLSRKQEHIKKLMKRFKKMERRAVRGPKDSIDADQHKKRRPDFMQPVFERNIATTKMTFETGQRHLEDTETAIQMLEDYVFQKDDLSAHPALAMGLMQFGFERRR